MSLGGELRARILRCVKAEIDHGVLADAVPGTSDYDLNPEARALIDAVRPLRPAAVLVPIIEREDGPTILLTKRTAHLADHAGQISFPGGRLESGETPVEAALREAEEEVGLDRSFVEVAGYIDAHETVTGFHITPVVSFVRPGFALKLDAFEVAEAFEVPLDFLFNPANHQEHSRIYKNTTRRYYAMPYGEYYIWGATARILVNLYRRAHSLI
jgi:8-oxo-dGTP pyrophosphatase MutT (NUDIX family)